MRKPDRHALEVLGDNEVGRFANIALNEINTQTQSAHLEKELSVGQSVSQSRACGMSRPYIPSKYSTGALVGGCL